MTVSDALEKLKDAVRVRHFSHATEKSYSFWLRSYMAAVCKYPADWAPEKKIERFLTDEARRGVAAGTQNQAMNALMFFYKAVLKVQVGARWRSETDYSHGGNDGLRGISPKQTAENLAGIIKRARAKFPALTVIVAGMQMPGNMGREFVEQFSAVFPSVAKENDAVLLPFLIEGVGGIAEFNQADLIHPNAEGQKRVAGNVWAVLKKVVEARGTGRK